MSRRRLKPGATSGWRGPQIFRAGVLLVCAGSVAFAQTIRKPFQVEEREVRRATPAEPPTPPAVPFEFDPPSAPAPKAKPSFTPEAVPKTREAGPEPAAVKPAPVAAKPKPPTVFEPAPKPKPVPPPDSPATEPAPTDGAVAMAAETNGTEIRLAPTSPEAPGTEARPDQAQLDIANSFYARKMFDMAAPEYERYLGMYPNAADRQTAMFWLAESYRSIGNMNAARNSYQMLVSTYTTGDFVGRAAYRLADLHYQDKNYDAALPLYRKASVRLKEPALICSAKFYAARCLESTRQPVDARALYEDLVAIKENNPFREASRLSLAQLLADAGKKAEAAKQYELLTQEATKPEIKAEAMVKMGLLEVDLAEYDKANATLRKALKLPGLGKLKDVAELGLIRLLYQGEKYKQLLDTYETEAKGLSAEAQPEVLWLAANSHRQLGDHPAARALYDQLIKQFPASVYAKESQYERLITLYSTDDPALNNAVDAFVTANPESDKRDQALLLKAESLFKKQDYAAAAPIYAAFDRSKLQSSLKAEALFKLGWCHLQTKDTERAIKAFTDFLDNNPTHRLAVSAYTRRALAYQQAKNINAALKDFSTVLTRFPKAKECELALEQKAMILGQQQDNQGMSETFQELLKQFPKTAAAGRAHFWIGWAAFEGKNYKEAAKALEQARAVDKEEFFEKATLRIILSYYNLEERDAVGREVEAYYQNPGSKGKVPGEIVRWIGGEYLKEKSYPEAEKFFSLLTSKPGLEPASDDWLNLSRSQLKQRKCKEAIAAVGTYLAAATEPIPRASGLLVSADAQLCLGKFEEAQSNVDEVLSLQPEGRLNEEGRLLAGEIQMSRQEYEQAGKLFLAVSIVSSDDSIIPRALAKAHEAYKKAGKEAESVKILNDLQTKYPEYLQRSGNIR